MLTFEVGRKYPKSQIREAVGLEPTSKGGPLNTGIAEYAGDFLIFTNVGTAGRTGHDYDNRWEGPLLRWSHRNSSKIHWKSVQKLLTSERIHVFWRADNKAVYTYAGYAQAVSVFETSPVGVLWAFTDKPANVDFSQSPGEVAADEYREGAVRQVWVNLYERDRSARQACLEYYGYRCVVCGLRFEERYGEIGKDYIHVHHLVPLSEIRQPYKVDPIEDLRPICPNCHAMVHRRKPPISIESVSMMLREQRNR